MYYNHKYRYTKKVNSAFCPYGAKGKILHPSDNKILRIHHLLTLGAIREVSMAEMAQSMASGDVNADHDFKPPSKKAKGDETSPVEV
jgi:hypothetical protein